MGHKSSQTSSPKLREFRGKTRNLNENKSAKAGALSCEAYHDTLGHVTKWLSYSRGREVDMTREEAYARCPADSYVEFYGGRWLIVPLAPVEQPRFFVAVPGRLHHT
jgi:hypothetical protein